ncbi:MAG: sodium:solute symporter family protein [Deltaproteobacteria bacterium]
MIIGVALALYVLLVIGIGIASNRKSDASPEDYFLAGRGLGSVVLFMALFGTNCTAFVLVGIPGRAYHDGVAVFGVNAPIIALGIPLCFWLIGSPARRMGIRLGALTPAELYRKRFDSRALGLLLFAVYALYTIPYMVTAVKGAAVTLTGVTDGAVPQWVGGLAVMSVALLYTTVGGMRATAWTNVFQGTLFLVFMVVGFVLIARSLGGFEAATVAVQNHDPSLLQIKDGPLYTPGGWTSWSFAITLTVIGFPHMLVRLMAGKSEDALRTVSRFYPIALLLLWVPAVMLGVWGAAAFPGLEGRASDRIFSLMSANHLPAAFGSLGFVAVLAAVMSTLDAQILVLSSMLVRDVLKAPKDAVRAGRWFGLAVSVVVFVLSVTWGSSVFEIASFAFSGYVTLAPVLFLGVRWKACTREGAIASIVVGNVVLLLGVAKVLPTFGFLPVFWALVAGTITAIVVSRFTRGTGDVALAFS